MFNFIERERILDQKIEYYSVKAYEAINSFMSAFDSHYAIELERKGRRIKMFLIRDSKDILSESRWLSKRRMTRSLKEIAQLLGP